MAIQYIEGPMLNTNLQRYGVDLAIETDLFFVDATNNRIGINNAAPADQFHVIGGATVDSLSMAGSTIISNVVNTDINISPNGTGFVVVPREKISSLTANGIIYATIGGELVEDASLTFTPAGGLSSTLATLGTLDFAADTISRTGNINITATGNNVTVNSLQISDLAGGAIPFIGATGDVFDSPALTWDNNTTTLAITGTAVVSDVTIAGSTIATTASDLVLSSPITGVTQITGTTAMRVPSGSTVQRPAAPVQADLRFNTVTLQLEFYDGTTWTVAGTDVQAISQDTFVGDDTTTVFTLTEPASDSANLLVAINGVIQHAGIAYGVSGTTVTFVTAPASTDTIDVRNITRSYSFDLLSDATGATKMETIGGQIVLTTGNTARVSLLANGVLDLSSAQSLRLPQYTIVQTNAIASPAGGDTVYVTDGNVGAPCLAVFDGTNWQKILFAGIL